MTDLLLFLAAILMVFCMVLILVLMSVVDTLKHEYTRQERMVYSIWRRVNNMDSDN